MRLTMGAAGRQIIRSFTGDGRKLSALGLVVGLPWASSASTTWTPSSVRSPSRYRPVAGIAALGVLMVGTAAVWLPACRAASVDPAVTLRGESPPAAPDAGASATIRPLI